MNSPTDAGSMIEVAGSPSSLAVMIGIPIVTAVAAAAGWLLAAGSLPDPGRKPRTDLMYASGAAACSVLAVVTAVIAARAWAARHRLVVATPEQLAIATLRGRHVIQAPAIRTIGQANGSGPLIVVDANGRRARAILAPRDGSWASVARQLRELYQR